MKIKVTKKDTIWSFIGTILSMGVNLIILPFILYFLDETSIGLYYVFTSISAIASLFDFGFSPSVSRNLAYAWSGVVSLQKVGIIAGDAGEPNYSLAKKVLRACNVVYTILSIVALFLSLTVGTFYLSIVTEGFANGMHFISWMIYALAIFLNIKYGYYSICLRGIGAVASVNKAMVLSKIAQIVASIILLLFGSGLIGVAVAYLLHGFLFRIIARKYFDIETKEHLDKVKLNRNEYETKKIVKTIWPNTWREGLVTLSNYLLGQATTIIASLFLPLAEVGIFSMTTQLTTALGAIASTLYVLYQPSLQSAYANGDVKRQKDNLSLIIFSYCVLYAIGLIALLTIGRPLIHLIKPTYSLSFPVVFLIGLYQFILKYRDCYCSFISTTNRLLYTKSFLISAVICVVLSVILTGLCNLGVYGLVFASLLSQSVFNVWYWPHFVKHELSINTPFIIRNAVLQIKAVLREKHII